MNLNNFDEWKRFMRASIQSASIVKQCHWKMERGAGAPDEDDMNRYIEEAGAIADLWEERMDRVMDARIEETTASEREGGK